MNFFKRYKDFEKKYKATDAYKREAYYNKTKLKLIATIFPLALVGSLLIKKYFGIGSHSFVFGVIVACILAVNLGADYLTKKNFKE